METPGRGHPAPEHAGLLQAPRHREAVRGPDARATGCCWPNGPRGSPPSRTRWPTATRSSGSPAPSALGRGPDPGRARRAGTAGLPPRRRRSGWPTPPGWPWPRPGSAGTRSGCCGWSASCAAAGSAAASSSPAGSAGPPQLAPADLLAAVGELDRRDHAGPAAAARHRVVPGPAAPHRAAAPRTGPRARRAGPDRPRLRDTEDARQARPYDAYGSLAVRRRAAGRTATRMARLEVRAEEIAQSFHLLRQAAGELAGAGGGPLRVPCEPVAAGARQAGPRPRRARCSTTSAGDGLITPLPGPVRLLPQPGPDARGLRRRHPDRLPVHRGQLRPVRGGGGAR